MSLPSKILSFDIGGTGIKAGLLNLKGQFLLEKQRVETPPLRTAAQLVTILAKMAENYPGYDAISVGFPGVIKRGVILSSPTLSEKLEGAPLQKLLEKQFQKPIRIRNDAEVQALPVIKGKGVEVVLTLGTGFGFAWFIDGQGAGHLEMSTHPLMKHKTYNDVLGDKALKKKGKKKWLKDVDFALQTIAKLTNFDHLAIGGGNARHLPKMKQVQIVSNDYGIVGGAWLWHEEKA